MAFQPPSWLRPNQAPQQLGLEDIFNAILQVRQMKQQDNAMYRQRGMDMAQLGFDPAGLTRGNARDEAGFAEYVRKRQEEDRLKGQQAQAGLAQTRASTERDLAAAEATRRGQTYFDPQNPDQRYALPTGAKPLPKNTPVVGVKPPAGYRYTNGGDLEAIPGGPASAKEEKATEKELSAARSGVQQATRQIDRIDTALKRTGPWTTGLPGKIFGSIPGTTAKNLRADLTTIKANLGFSELQAMRAASPTGGALGQVAVQELEALQSTLASLDPEQSDDTLKANLGQVRQHYQNWRETLSGRMPGETHGGQTQYDAEKERRYQEWKRNKLSGGKP